MVIHYSNLRKLGRKIYHGIEADFTMQSVGFIVKARFTILFCTVFHEQDIIILDRLVLVQPNLYCPFTLHF